MTHKHYYSIKSISYILALALAPTLLMAQVSNDSVNGVKLRGDGTVDDTQPGVARAVRRTGLDDIGPNGLKLRGDGTVDDAQPGVRRGPIEDRSRRERFVEDGKRIERRYDFGGNLIRERIRDDHSGRGGGDRNDRSGRGERSGHDDHFDHMARNDRPDRADRSERGERSERSERAERSERSERAERSERSDRAERDNSGHGGRN